MSTRLLMIIALCVGLNGTLQAQTWKRLGPAGGMVISLGTGSDGTLYLGTADGHVFASQNGAEDWQLRGRVSGRTDAVITRLISDTRQAHHMLAAVWYLGLESGGGIFQSQDQGHTWTQLGLEHEAVRALETSAGNPGLLVAGTRTGVFRSEDDGTVWQRISPAGDSELRNIDSVEIDPSDSKVIYAGTYHLPWKTTDGGKTWKPVAAGLIDDSDVMSMRVDLTNPARLYLSACSGIYRTENQGDSWTKLQGIPYSARRTHQIVQDPAEPEALYAATTEGLWVTRDGGESWERATPKEWVVNSVVVASAPNRAHERVLIGTDAQGVLVSDDSGKHFRPANDGFTHEVVTQLVASPSTRKHRSNEAESKFSKVRTRVEAGLPYPSVSERRANQTDWKQQMLK